MRDLLDYGKGSVLHRGPARLRDIARRALRSCAHLARDRKVELETAIDEDMPPSTWTARGWEQALQNLVANAVQHAPEGTSVKIGGRREEREGRVFACCTIEDQGPGLRGEDLPRIFEPFFSRRKGGTGLGVSIVQRVVEAHGGEVTAENRESGGARFMVMIPTAGAREREPRDA